MVVQRSHIYIKIEKYLTKTNNMTDPPESATQTDGNRNGEGAAAASDTLREQIWAMAVELRA